MEEKKLPHLMDMVGLARTLQSYMWFAIPGGLIMGKPITREEYNAMLFAEHTEQYPSEQDQQIFPLEDVTLEAANKPKKFRSAMVDGRLVSAYGLFKPEASVKTSDS